jgi:hypothetical protein
MPQAQPGRFDEFVPFDEQMETIDTIPGPEPTPQVAPVG